MSVFGDATGYFRALPGVTRGVLWMVAASFFYALTFVTIRELSRSFSVFEMVLFRAALAVAFMLPWLVRSGIGALRTSRWKLYAIRAVVSYTGMVCWFYGLANLPLADATALIFTAPFFTLIFLSLAIGEHVGLRRWLAIGLGFAGALIVIRPGLVEITLPTFALLYTAVSYGGSNAATRALAITETPNAVVFYMFALALPLALGPALADWTTPGWADLPLIAALGILSLVSMQCMTRALAAAPAGIVMPLFYLQLPFVAALAYVLYSEIPGIWIWVGGGLICSTSYYIARTETRLAQRSRRGQETPPAGRVE